MNVHDIVYILALQIHRTRSWTISFAWPFVLKQTDCAGLRKMSAFFRRSLKCHRCTTSVSCPCYRYTALTKPVPAVSAVFHWPSYNYMCIPIDRTKRPTKHSVVCAGVSMTLHTHVLCTLYLVPCTLYHVPFSYSCRYSTARMYAMSARHRVLHSVTCTFDHKATHS